VDIHQKGKSKRAYIAWDENEVSSSNSSSSEDEKSNLCFSTEYTPSLIALTNLWKI